MSDMQEEARYEEPKPYRHSCLDEPFGSWPLDRYIKDLDPRRPITGGPTSVYVFEEKYVLKVYGGGDPLEEVDKMLLAGPDCAVQVLGRIYDTAFGRYSGFIMPYEKALTSGFPLVDEKTYQTNTEYFGSPFRRLPLSKQQKRSVIDQLCELVDRLHAKGIIHGDIKPGNLLLCSGDKLRFCDFDTAALESEKSNSGFFTNQYVSPFRMRDAGYYKEPITKADDLYAVGVCIWEIWTDILPFSDLQLTRYEIEDAIAFGLRPDLAAVDDPEIAALITKYLDMGPKLPINSVMRPTDICIESYGIAFLECKESPPHTYSQFARCCYTNNPGEEKHCCPNPVRVPQSPTSMPSVLICPKCNFIEYRGI